jgi:hypothetical protein
MKRIRKRLCRCCKESSSLTIVTPRPRPIAASWNVARRVKPPASVFGPAIIPGTSRTPSLSSGCEIGVKLTPGVATGRTPVTCYKMIAPE